MNVEREFVNKNEPGLIFFGDAIQYNRIAYKRIGKHLAEIIMVIKK
jgi:hypothetical protein